jgi:hypothetical protein
MCVVRLLYHKSSVIINLYSKSDIDFGTSNSETCSLISDYLVCCMTDLYILGLFDDFFNC